MMLFHRAYSRLTSCDPREFWTSGQWMTERKGGSDVGMLVNNRHVCDNCCCIGVMCCCRGLGTETVAVSQSDGRYRLYGYKWFSSASDSDMTLTLARIADENGQVTEVYIYDLPILRVHI